MIADTLASLDTVALQRAASACFNIAAALSLVLVIGWCGYHLLRGAGPYPLGGVWRRDHRGRPVCPPCAEARTAANQPLLPLDAAAPVDPLDKCSMCLAYRAEETANG